MISFETDYIEGCHENILDAFVRTNLVQVSGYGKDAFCASAKEKIKKACGQKNAEVFFLSGGTQTNQIVIDTMLQPYEGVIAANTGHVNVHEAGAIEFTGHKVLALPEHDGKLDAKEVESFVKAFYADGNHEHMVFPKMVYISHPTELGTLYSAKELDDLSKVCHENGLILFMDGARMGYGLASKQTDVTLEMIAEKTDVFYIGGTKVGAMSGEALVFTKNNVPSHFITRIKQHGALLAKGRLLGIQFDTLFSDDLYMSISKHAIEMAEQLKEIFHTYNYRFYLESPTNQQFIIVDNETMKALSQEVKFSFWDVYDEDHTIIRFVTSWATKQESLNQLKEILSRYAR